MPQAVAGHKGQGGTYTARSAEGGILAETLAPAVGDALIATARGAKQDAADRAALTRPKIVEAGA